MSVWSEKKTVESCWLVGCCSTWSYNLGRFLGYAVLGWYRSVTSDLTAAANFKPVNVSVYFPPSNLHTPTNSYMEMRITSIPDIQPVFRESPLLDPVCILILSVLTQGSGNWMYWDTPWIHLAWYSTPVFLSKIEPDNWRGGRGRGTSEYVQ